MTTVKLLDQYNADIIRGITADLEPHTMNNGDIRIPEYVAYTGEGTLKPATKRATCRLCGQKIREGLQLSFFYDEEQNSWTAKEYHVHADGCPA